MDIATLKDRLGDDYDALETYIATLAGQRDAARKEAIEKRKELQAEVEQLRALKATLFERLGLSDESELETLPDAKGQAEAVKQFEARVKRLEKELAEKDTALQATNGKYRETRLNAALQKALGGQPWVDQELVESYLKQRLDWQDDELMYRHGETPVPLDEGVKLLMKDKPNLLKQVPAGGSGWNPANQAGAGKPSADELSRQLFAQVAGKPAPTGA
jgi:uncharacterized coiled-coil protein SlyX